MGQELMGGYQFFNWDFFIFGMLCLAFLAGGMDDADCARWGEFS